MIKIVQHIPEYCSGPEPQTAVFSTIDELIEIPFVKKWITYPTFKRLSQSIYEDGDDTLLMAEICLGDVHESWCIGYMDEAVPLLPEWSPFV